MINLYEIKNFEFCDYLRIKWIDLALTSNKEFYAESLFKTD